MEKKIEEKEVLTIKKDGSLIWNNKEIDFTSLKSLLDVNNKIIINIDEETSIQNFNNVIKIFKSKEIKKIFINVKHKNDKI